MANALLVEDDCLVTFMMCNNSFTRGPWSARERDDYYWDGILLQIGTYKDIGPGGGPSDIYEGVDIANRANPLSLVDFDWINVVGPVGPRLAPPMSVAHFMTEFRHRNRKLHQYFEFHRPAKPHRIITYWAARPVNYSLAARSAGADHVKFNFTFDPSNVTVEVYLDVDANQTPDYTLKGGTTITVKRKNHLNHLGHQDPPW